jgi:hypothetical protein
MGFLGGKMEESPAGLFHAPGNADADAPTVSKR